MSQKLTGAYIGAALLLAACGAPAADQAASTAASAANQAASALPSSAADQAASAANQAASAAASVANQAASALPSDAVSAAASAASSALAGVTASDLAGVVPSNLALQSSQPLVLSTTSQVAGVTNYRWTVVQVPPGAESVQGEVIAENSDGKLTLNPADYAQYFPVSGNYVINLDLTNADGSVTTQPIPLVVP